MGEITGKSFVEIKESSVLFLHRNKFQVERIFNTIMYPKKIYSSFNDIGNEIVSKHDET